MPPKAKQLPVLLILIALNLRRVLSSTTNYSFVAKESGVSLIRTFRVISRFASFGIRNTPVNVSNKDLTFSGSAQARFWSSHFVAQANAPVIS